MFVGCKWVQTEAQRGHQIPCSWSTRQNGCWGPALGPLEEQTAITTALGVLFQSIYLQRLPPVLPQGLPFSTRHTASPLLSVCLKLYSYWGFVCIWVCAPRVCLVPRKVRRTESHRLPLRRQTDPGDGIWLGNTAGEFQIPKVNGLALTLGT